MRHTPTLLAGLAASLAISTLSPALAGEPAAKTDVTRTTCADLGADTVENRAFALMFYYGYVAGRSGASEIEDAKVPGHLNAVRDYCNANPQSTIVQAFVAALKPA
jgi:hypothetical protein